MSVPGLNSQPPACRTCCPLAWLPACRFDQRSSDAVSIGRETSNAARFLIRPAQASKGSPKPSNAPLPFPGSSSFGRHAVPGSPSRKERDLSQRPTFQGARPLWSCLERRPCGQGAGMQSASKPPTPDAIMSPHRLSGFRTRAPLRRSGNRPVRTVGRNGGVWYMMRNDSKTHVVMQCNAHA